MSLIFNNTPVEVTVGRYTNGRLYVGLIDLTEGELFSDITINLPAVGMENPFDGALSTDCDTAKWLEEIGAGTSTGKEVDYNMGKYTVFHFYPGRLKELDPEGFKRFIQ